MIKLGVIFVPGTLQLTKKDVAYRANAANIEMFVCVNDEYVLTQVENALPDASCIKYRAMVGGGKREGWADFNEVISTFP